MKNLLRRITKGLFVFGIVISIFSFNNVLAANYPAFCDNKEEMLVRYGITLTEAKTGSENDYVITMNPETDNNTLLTKLRSNKFKVVQVNGNLVSDNRILTYGSPLVIDGVFDSNGKMEVILESTDANTDPDCPGTMKFTLSLSNFCAATDGCTEKITNETISTSYDLDAIRGQSITCDNMASLDPGSFAYKFCDVKNKAIAAGNKYVIADKFEGNISLKCDVNKFDTTTADGYYVNKSYYYGSSEIKKDAVTYVYHFAPGHVKTKTGVACEVNCEEALVVEYGPPVASKAGLCFEYKVKVTSRVSCNMIKKPEEPDNYNTVCTPVPICQNSARTYEYNQGGPSEEFDSCIKACDNGKYTDKCVNSCYKKIYGKSSKKTVAVYRPYAAEKLDYLSNDDYNLDKCMANTEEFSVGNGGGSGKYKGCYTVSGNTILWQGKRTNNSGWSNAPGRWYAIASHKYLGEYYVNGSGFYMHDYDGTVDGSGNTCRDDCFWTGCKDSNGNVSWQYLNPGQAQKDAEKNAEAYEKAYNSCVAAASCTTSQGEFTISVDYLHNENGTVKEKTINFPYTESGSEKDIMKSDKDKCADAATSNAAGATRAKSTILSYDGCYKNQCGPEIMYMTEWSFPGTWINNKTGAVSYVDKSGSGEWQTKPDKFCIPLDAKNVNQKWWRYYMNKEFVETADTSVEAEPYLKDCEVYTPKTPVESDIEKWNIHARTNGFGYFGWNINIDCFYAIASKSALGDGEIEQLTCEDDDRCCVARHAYDIRPADTRDVFPDPDGGDGGRDPGYNWTDFAATPENADYPILPERYLSDVQDVGYASSIYSDQYLDYQFELTPQILKQLHNVSKNKKYSDFNGTTLEIGQGQVAYYKSDLLRSGSGILKDQKYPPVTTLKCNNLVNWNEQSNCYIPD